MNIVLLEPHELQAGKGTLADARANHIRTFLHGAPGSTFRIGIINGLCGTATITHIAEDGAVSFEATCDEPALAPWYDLILALPRPRSFKRILFQSAAMGVRNIYVVGAKKVEKSYFNMHLLREEEYRPVLIEGLMQAKTTALPTLHIVPKLKDLWDLLPAESTLRFIANPAPRDASRPCGTGCPIVAIGPDGGWTNQENEAFAQHGFYPITLGPRPLRTDTAAIALPAILQADYEPIVAQ
jgi:RsmE family RNA methyltransferase